MKVALHNAAFEVSAMQQAEQATLAQDALACLAFIADAEVDEDNADRDEVVQDFVRTHCPALYDVAPAISLGYKARDTHSVVAWLQTLTR